MNGTIQSIEAEIQPFTQKIESAYSYNFRKVLDSFQLAQVATHHMAPSFGYGLSDIGIETLESLVAHIFHAEAALVRPQFISGTQVLFLILNSLLKKGDFLLSVVGTPYETLQGCIGLHSHYPGNLISQGIRYAEADLTADIASGTGSLIEEANVIWIQKSCGYSTRRSLSNLRILELVKLIRCRNKMAIIAVDNCYGEFVEPIEPVEAGADICAGSFLKNPGGGITRTGAYITGKKTLLDKCASHYIAPGMGFETTPNIGLLSTMFQGLFHAPHTVKESLLGNLFMSRFLGEYGIRSFPKWDDPHYDIVLRIEFQTGQQLMSFAELLQQCSPIDSFAKPTPFHQDGYSSPIVMAGGTFTPGSSIEFSADGFVKYPYRLYYQPGMYYEQTKIFAEVLETKLFNQV
ncbi:MAG: methionine gamma-lyase family protein [Caldisericia bacterium]|nr:methionine gamma-lyase family protein [Caldisericia bacterium]